jgi:hypothetical protein
MTKANSSTKSTHESITDDFRGRSTVTRRLAMNMIVRGTAAVAVAAVPAAANASSAALAQIDPIFAVIERHRAESRAYDQAIGDQSKLEETLPEEITRSPRVQFGMKDGQPYYLHSHHDIDDRLEWMPDFARTPEIRARLYDEFGLDVAEILAKQDECGLAAAELRTEQLSYSCQKLAWAIATTVPTSMAGVAAVLRYANEWEDAGEEWPGTDEIGSDGWHYQLRQTLAEALGAIIS